MHIRSIHIRGHKVLGSFSLDFSHEGKVGSNILLYGGNCSGKTLLLDLISYIYRSIYSSRKPSFEFEGDYCRIDFDYKNEIIPILIRGSEVEGVHKIAALFGKKSDNMILHYKQSLLLDLPYDKFSNISYRNLGLRVLYPLLSDLHNHTIRDSIILIDDFDFGLDSLSVSNLYRYLYSHHGTLGNQLILTSHKSYDLDILGLGLLSRIDPLEVVEGLL